ncbi:MAG: sulfotransferase [Steroidobacteraceae bacterium]
MASVLFSEAQRLIETGRFAAAARSARTLLADEPRLTEGWLLLALAEQRQQRFDAMLAALHTAMRISPTNVTVLLKFREAQLYCGLGAEARSGLAALERGAQQDVRLLTAIANLYVAAGAHDDRLRCAQRALAVAPGEPSLLANVAAAETACGLMDTAEAHLDQLLALQPQDHGSHYRRSILRRQTPERNHVREMSVRLASLPVESSDAIALCFALAKEHEDLGEHLQAGAFLQRGAALRRRNLSYGVADDEHALRVIGEQFGAEWLAAHRATGERGAAAIFVMGLPRSGTTLVDRILSSHSAVQSLGEINDLAYAITAQAYATMDADAAPPARAELIRRAAHLDPATLGNDYLRRVAGYVRNRPRFIDKTPWNFLYLGLIAQALPGARIVHVRRDPLDSCFALYKTLFRDGSPYSYDLQDLARYYLAYHQLMEHWRQMLPGRFLDLDYECVVGSQSDATRELLDWCGLPFEARCLDFHANTAPAATASAAQVREPVHTRSIGNWRNYASQLEPLIAQLRAGGLTVG